MWTFTEDSWNKTYKWFLIDEGEIQYSFCDKFTAQSFMKKYHLDFMLLTNIDNIIHDTMLDPCEYRSWSCKIQKCVDLQFK